MRLIALALMLPILLSCSVVAAVTGPSGKCGGPTPHAIGTTSTATLGANECTGPGDISGHLYTLSLTQQTDFNVSMNPSGFHGAIGIWTASNKLVFENTDDGILSSNVFLPAGQYVLVAGRQFTGGGGYTLATQATALNGCSPSTAWTAPGATISGTITSNDCAGNGLGRQDIYIVWLAAGQTVTVTATMNQLGAVLFHQNGTAIAEPAIAKGGTTTFTYTSPAARNYSLHMISGNYAQGPITYSVSIK